VAQQISQTALRFDINHLVKAKFHYASWFEAGSKLVVDRFEAGRRPASKLFATSFEPDVCSLAVLDPRVGFEADSVMEFGFEPVSTHGYGLSDVAYSKHFIHSAAISELLVLQIFLAHDTTT